MKKFDAETTIKPSQELARCEEREYSNIEITPEEFLSTLNSENFLKALNIAGHETAKSGHETGFTIELLEDKTTYIPYVTKGGLDQMAGGEELKTIDGEQDFKIKNLKKRKGVLLRIHFHPTEKEAIIPSPEDLMGITTKINQPAFVGICQIEGHSKKIEMLLIKSSGYIIEDRDLLEYKEKTRLEFVSRQSDIIELLQKEGFESELLEFEKQKQGYQLSGASKKSFLNKFKQIKAVIYKLKE